MVPKNVQEGVWRGLVASRSFPENGPRSRAPKNVQREGVARPRWSCRKRASRALRRQQHRIALQAQHDHASQTSQQHPPNHHHGHRPAAHSDPQWHRSRLGGVRENRRRRWSTGHEPRRCVFDSCRWKRQEQRFCLRGVAWRHSTRRGLGRAGCGALVGERRRRRGGRRGGLASPVRHRALMLEPLALTNAQQPCRLFVLRRQTSFWRRPSSVSARKAATRRRFRKCECRSCLRPCMRTRHRVLGAWPAGCFGTRPIESMPAPPPRHCAGRGNRPPFRRTVQLKMHALVLRA